MLVLGTHTVRSGEYLYCIGRAYGVVPEAIAEFNSLLLNAPLAVGQVLLIPDVRWVNIPPGRVCEAQFDSPYSLSSSLISTSVTGIFPNVHSSIENAIRLVNFVGPNEVLKRSRLQSAFLDETPSAIPTREFRTVYIKWPTKMYLGESDIVIMTFNPGTGQITISTSPPTINVPPIPTNTPNPSQNTDSSNPIDILYMTDEYQIFAIARLDAAGFDYSPKEDVQKPLNVGQAVAWQWSIKPQEAGTQEIIISLRLHFEAMNNKTPPLDNDIWNKSYPVKVDRTPYEILFGSQAPILPAVAGVFLSLFALGKDASTLWGFIGQKIRPTKKASDSE